MGKKVKTFVRWLLLWKGKHLQFAGLVRNGGLVILCNGHPFPSSNLYTVSGSITIYTKLLYLAKAAHRNSLCHAIHMVVKLTHQCRLSVEDLARKLLAPVRNRLLS
jgi:hypothetical protein